MFCQIVCKTANEQFITVQRSYQGAARTYCIQEKMDHRESWSWVLEFSHSVLYQISLLMRSSDLEIQIQKLGQ